MHWVLRAVVVVSLLVVGTKAAHADDPFAKPAAADARDHLAKGNKLYAVRDFEKAIDEYKAGALIESATIFDYNLGQCYRQIGRYDDAIWFYERFVNRAHPTGDVLSAVNEFIRQMKAEREKKAMTQAPTEAAPATTSPKVETLPSPTTTAPAPHVHKTNYFAAGLTIAGGVGMVIGGGLLWDAHSLNDDANHTTSQQERDGLHSKADTRSLAGTIVGLGGVAILGTGLAMWYFGRDSGSSSDTASWHLGASTDTVFVFGRF
jgi:tetratricopeptide (TPR) repeat protein